MCVAQLEKYDIILYCRTLHKLSLSIYSSPNILNGKLVARPKKTIHELHDEYACVLLIHLEENLASLACPHDGVVGKRAGLHSILCVHAKAQN